MNPSTLWFAVASVNVMGPSALALAPSALITSPQNATTYGANWGGVLAGTTETSSGVTVSSVALGLENVTSSTYWNGTSWQKSPTTVTATGTSTWSYSLPAGDLASGDLYSITAAVTDGAGNSGNTTVQSFTYSTTSPTVAITSPATGTVSGSGSISGTATPSGGATISSVSLTVKDTSANRYWNGTSWQSTTTAITPDGTNFWNLTVPMGSMTLGHAYAVTATTNDSAGNAGSASSAFTFNNAITPTITTSSPLSTVIVQGGASGSSTSLTVVSTSGFPSSGRISVPVSAGTLLFSYSGLTATSFTGLARIGGMASWPIANGAPVGITYGMNWSGVITGTMHATNHTSVASVSLTVYDATSGKYWSGSNWSTGATALSASISSNTWTYTFLAGYLVAAGDQLVVNATVTDSAGNTAASQSSFIDDDTVPVATVTSPSTTPYTAATGYPSSTFTGTMSAGAVGASLSGIALYLYDDTNHEFWDGSSWEPSSVSIETQGGNLDSGQGIALAPTSTTSTTWSYTFTGSVVSPHVYYIFVALTDTAGNSALIENGSMAPTSQFSYDNTPPVFTDTNTNAGPSSSSVGYDNGQIVAGDGATGAPVAGSATTSPLDGPSGVAVDSSGNIYVADTGNNRVEKVTPSGTLSVIAGTTSAGVSVPGVATRSPLDAPQGVAVDSSGNVYIADTGNNCIEKVTPSGTLSVVAGKCGPARASTPPATGGGATAVGLDGPAGVAVDAAGNIYIADTNNSLIEKVSGTSLSVVAGSSNTSLPEASGPGWATSMQLGNPQGVAVDSAGNVYVADTGNSLIERVTTSGYLSVLNEYQGCGPTGVALDSYGDVFSTDPCGVEEMASDGSLISSSVNPGQFSDALDTVAALAIDSSGNLYTAENNSVNEIQKQAKALLLTGNAADYVFANPNLASVSAMLENTTTGLYWNGTAWGHSSVTNTYANVGLEALATGSSISYPVAPLSAMTSGDSYTIVGSVTDIVGFSSPTSSAHFTYNTTPVSSVVITTPTNGGFYGQNWRGSIAGTAASANGISSVSVVLEDASTGEFWNGSSFTPSYAAVTASGGTAWSVSVPGAAMNTLNAGDVLYITARASDSYGNSASTATVFTYDNTAPNESQDAFDPLGEYGPNTWPGTMTGTSSAAAAGASLGANSTSLVTADTSSGTVFTGSGWAAPTSVTDGAATGTSTTLDVTSTAGYPSTGRLWVVTGSGLELDSYSGTTATSFTGVTLVTGDGGWTIPAPGTVSGTGMSGTSTTLNVTSTAGYPTAGTITVPSSGGTLVFSYDSKTATSFTSLALVSGDPTWTIANGTAFGASVLPATVATVTPVIVPSTTSITNGLTWSESLAAANLTSGHLYSLSAIGYDLAANITTGTGGFFYSTSAPTVAITSPASTTVFGPPSTPTVNISGTTAPATGLGMASIAYTLEDTTASASIGNVCGSGVSPCYWNGTGWQGSVSSATPAGVASWSTSGLTAPSFLNGHNYSLTASATDSGGNVATASAVTFTPSNLLAATGTRVTITGTATDSSGALYEIGYYSGGNMTVGGTTLTVPYGGDQVGFVAKYTSNGAFAWARAFGGSTLGLTTVTTGGIAVDSAGYIDIDGSFSSGALSATGTGFVNLALSKTGTTDGFIAQLTSTGSKSWAKDVGGSGSTVTMSGITAAPSGSSNFVVATGTLSGGNLSGPVTMTRTGTQDALIFECSAGHGSSSTLSYSAHYGVTSGSVSLAGVKTDSSGNVYVDGTTTKTLPAGTLGSSALTVTGSTDGLVAELSSALAVSWARVLGGTSTAMNLGAIGIDPSGNVDVGGNFSGSSTSGTTSGTYINLGLSLTGTKDGMVFQLTNSGGLSWAKDIGASSVTTDTSGLAVDSSGNVDFAGSSNGTLVVGGTTYSLLGTNDVVGGQFSSAGVLRSFFRAGGTSASVVSTQGNAGAISVDGNGFAYDAISASGGGLNFNGATQSFSGTQYGVLARIL